MYGVYIILLGINKTRGEQTYPTTDIAVNTNIKN